MTLEVVEVAMNELHHSRYCGALLARPLYAESAELCVFDKWPALFDRQPRDGRPPWGGCKRGVPSGWERARGVSGSGVPHHDRVALQEKKSSPALTDYSSARHKGGGRPNDSRLCPCGRPAMMQRRAFLGGALTAISAGTLRAPLATAQAVVPTPAEPLVWPVVPKVPAGIRSFAGHTATVPDLVGRIGTPASRV